MIFFLPVMLSLAAGAAEAGTNVLSKPGLFRSMTEPPCSYCSTQNRKGLIKDTDPVIAWIRGAHNGGAISIRHFLSAPRVINDTYGLFFYDADGDYVSVFPKDKGYEFFGWRNGVMLVQGPDGTLWSALSGRALEGPRNGDRLQRQPSFRTEWGHWMMLHPESTAYNLFDGKKYPVVEIPSVMSVEALGTLGKPDARLQSDTPVLGVELGDQSRAYPLSAKLPLACFTDRLGSKAIAVFWYAPTQSAVAFESDLNKRSLTFHVDADAPPESAPFKDSETGTRWSLAGRAVDGPLKGQELTWVNSVQCKWYAWAAEFPHTQIYVGQIK